MPVSTASRPISIVRQGSKRQPFGHGVWTCMKVGPSTAYLQTYQPGAMTDANKTSLTIQTGVPLYSGAVEPFTFAGCVCKGWSAACSPGEMLEVTFDIDAQLHQHTTDLAAPSYSAAALFNWTQAPNVKLTGATLAGVRGFSVAVENGLNVDRLLLDGTGKRARPVESALRSCILELEVEPTDLTKTWDDMVTDTGRVWVVELVSTQAIETTYYYTWRLTIPEGHLVGDPIDVGGPDEVLQTVRIEALDNGTDPLYKLEVQSTDTAI